MPPGFAKNTAAVQCLACSGRWKSAGLALHSLLYQRRSILSPPQASDRSSTLSQSADLKPLGRGRLSLYTAQTRVVNRVWNCALYFIKHSSSVIDKCMIRFVVCEGFCVNWGLYGWQIVWKSSGIVLSNEVSEVESINIWQFWFIPWGTYKFYYTYTILLVY